MDQMRGYAIFGMILVNYLGNFHAMPEQFKHHSDSMSYADTIAPLFMFIVGMGFRLSFLRRAQALGLARARWEGFRRFFILTLVGIVFYGADYSGSWWDALVDIGLAGVLAVPFIDRGPAIRVGAACVYLAVFQYFFTRTGYGEWTMSHAPDGGPLGPLSWCFNFLLGTLAYDLLVTRHLGKIAFVSILWLVVLSAAGWALRAEWSGVKAFWPFSQRAMSSPYPLYSTGLCFLTFLFFYVFCDQLQFRFPFFTILGENALVIYMVQNVIIDSNFGYLTHESRPAFAVIGFFGIFFSCYAVARRLHNDGILIKI